MHERQKELIKIINEHTELAEQGCIQSMQIVIHAQIELDEIETK